MSNPVLQEKNIEKFVGYEGEYKEMTLSGTMTKTFFLFVIMFIVASYNFMQFMQGFTDRGMMLTLVGGMLAFVVAMILSFSARRTQILAPLSMLYAGLEGLAIGGISAIFAASYGADIVVTAVMATFGTLLGMLVLYSTGIIKCSETFRSIIFGATLGILVVYLVAFVSSFFTPVLSNFLASNSLASICVSGFVCLIAAFNLILDFDMIEKARTMGATQEFEWYGAFSLMVTLVWLYVEILKLLGKTRSRK